jgi:anaerobic magnesium-protoporphyrin IX monomethyl ester cyclase
MEIILINYDNGSRWPVLPQNLFHLYSCIEDIGGHDISILDFNFSRIPPYEVLHQEEPGVVALGFISGYWPHQEALKIAEVIKNHPNRDSIHFVIGGHGPSADPLYYLEKLGADAVFTGSADNSFPLWLKNGMKPGIYDSLGYNMDVSQYYGGFDGFDVYKRIRFPNTKENEFAIQILSGRGCPYNCAFCFRMGCDFLRYDVANVIKDIKRYAIEDGIRHFQFSDELLMISPSITKEWCAALLYLQEEIGIDLFFDCNGRLNVAARDHDVLRMMKATGFRYINYGCESMSQAALDAMNKKQTVEQIEKGVENTIKAGLTPGLNFMFGNPGDDEGTLWEAVNFIIDYHDGTELRTIRPVTPYPGTELFNMLVAEGRCTGIDDFYDHHVNSDLFSYHFMDGITNEEANKMLNDANQHIFNDYIEIKSVVQKNNMIKFYSGDADPRTFRGFREV